MRQVTLVCGPSCSGKTTYVLDHAQPDDVVVDHDDLAQRAGSDRSHGHEQGYRDEATLAWYQLAAQVAEAQHGCAWVIRCCAPGPERAELARWLRADRVLVLMPPLEVVMSRAQGTRTRSAMQSIPRWYRFYSPAPGDELITSCPEADH